MSGQFIEVNVALVGKTKATHQIQMEKGVTFENKGGIYTVDENGQLKKFDKAGNVWQDAKQIEMTDYQWQAFQNVSNNDGNVKTYTKADIEKASNLTEKAFLDDMSKDLPVGYRLERAAQKPDKQVQVHVTNGDKSYATLKFSCDNNFQILNQNTGKVINYSDLENHPQKEVAIEGGKLVEGADYTTALPYVENGEITLKNGDYSTETCKYENGKLISYRRDVQGETVIRKGDYYPPTSSKGDHQYIEFYPNGQIKSVDIKILEYGDHDGVQMKCQYDEKGNYISGTRYDYDPYLYEWNWVNMDADRAASDIDLYLHNTL